MEWIVKILESLLLIIHKRASFNTQFQRRLWRYILLTSIRFGSKTLTVLFSSILILVSHPFDEITWFQGRDKDCIIVSFVRSREKPRSSGSSLLGDWHRINVALTRAKVRERGEHMVVLSSFFFQLLTQRLVCTEKVDNGGITKNTIKSSTPDASAEEG